jgi:hypothetical protein
MPPDVVAATQEILEGIPWPSAANGDKQPGSDRPVPGVSAPELAANLAEIQRQGADLDVCVAIARRAVAEWREDGKWTKAPQFFFGRARDSPWQAYYQAHLTNQAAEREAAEREAG